MTLDTFADLFADDLDAVADRLDEVVRKRWADAPLSCGLILRGTASDLRL